MVVQASDTSHKYLLGEEEWVIRGILDYCLPVYDVLVDFELKGDKGGYIEVGCKSGEWVKGGGPAPRVHVAEAEGFNLVI